MNFESVLKKLNGTDESIILIYAFNSMGKTRLSVAYKDATKDTEGRHTGVYYNAFSEDLFVWDNDEDNDGKNIRLVIRPSSLNQFHSFLYESRDGVIDKLAMYHPQYDFRFNAYEDTEKGIESVAFFMKGAEDTPIKISRGEERIFVWCFFLALLEIDGWANKQDAHVFIDDPVSSLDDHNIFVTVDTIFQQIEDHYKEKRIIVTTHHIGLFSILADRLRRGEKSGLYSRQTKLFVLNKTDGNLTLENPKSEVFLYHLHLLQKLREASRSKIYSYHVVLLRQVLEQISSFLGSGKMSYTLSEIGVQDADKTANMINSLSHKTAYYHQPDTMPPAMEDIFKDILEKLFEKYKFELHITE